ncbi:substrate-binding domain-containing protein [Clostridium pasteurianum]|uniref:DNA-binding protein, excisionase family n=1 Tax=Clostridium pasteurianum BC1 TaxID=86416 RepID=R4KF82_CLOPA|nr:helix-turn-helix transcriptional regulator [Clostridium pasteurianum]AGK98265.1 DNA-binding protein, excisionase family [Clostridium pasteurianum BC1]
MLQDTALTPQEVADILKIAKNTVYELIKRGELNAYKVGKKLRVDFKDVEAYKNKSKTVQFNQVNQLNNTVDDNQISLETLSPPLYESTSSRDFVICGQDVILDILSRYLEFNLRGSRILRSYTGCYNGLFALYLGKIHISTVHLWDGDSGEYNIPFVRRMLPGVPTIILHLACRIQGFYVAKGNPKNIKGWEDLKRQDISIINREKGSGTRILLDEHIRLLGIDNNSIPGYSRECFSHLAVASTVSRGGADLALGNEKTGLQVKNIDFIPLQPERYELVIKKEDLNKPFAKAVMEIVNSENFKTELEGLGGYDISETGKIVAEL